MRFYQTMAVQMRCLNGDESGQDLAEYALLGGLIALAAISSLVGYATTIKAALSDIGSKVLNLGGNVSSGS
jgi:Flp pilus assembly pilin Flp